MGEELKIELFRPKARGAIWSILYYILLVDLESIEYSSELLNGWWNLYLKYHDNLMSYRLATAICAISLTATSLLSSLPSHARKPAKFSSYPTSGKVLTLTNGDLMCYVELVDARGKKYNLGANFDICNQTKLVNKQVNLIYKKGKVNDCQSAEPCGKSRIENLIVKMQAVKK
jgi:hypothetical protein